MKLGRNEICPCGSGKKYKRCCMNSVSKQHASMQDDIEQVVAMNPNLSLDELKVDPKRYAEQQYVPRKADIQPIMTQAFKFNI